MNIKTQGFILLDVDVVALNNAGKSTSTHFDNAVATKKVRKNGRIYTYVSGQAWRYWWREALQKNFKWNLSPIIREDKIAFTDADPIKYPDDDIFGYMKAAKDFIKDKEGNTLKDKKGKEQKVDVTVTRTSPLKNSVLISVGSVQVAENWSSMARQEGDSVPYGKEEYSAVMKGMFSLDLFQAGTFANYNKTGFKNLPDNFKKTDDLIEIDDPFIKDKSGQPHKLIRIKREERLKRIKETIQALKIISGGAMQTSNMGDVTPKFIVLATTKSGNHPFSHIVKSTSISIGVEKVELNIDGLKQVLEDYKDQLVGPVFIGKRSGFMDEYEKDITEKLVNYFITAEDLKKITTENLENANDKPSVFYSSINNVIDLYCNYLEKIVK